VLVQLEEGCFLVLKKMDAPERTVDMSNIFYLPPLIPVFLNTRKRLHCCFNNEKTTVNY